MKGKVSLKLKIDVHKGKIQRELVKARKLNRLIKQRCNTEVSSCQTLMIIKHAIVQCNKNKGMKV